MPLKLQFPCGRQHDRNGNIRSEFPKRCTLVQKALGATKTKVQNFFQRLKKLSVLNLSEVRAKERNAIPKTKNQQVSAKENI